MVQPARIGTAGWTIPRDVESRFPDDGTHLARYAQVFSAVEINSAFYRPHQRKVYERWAASTPGTFRFAVKMPKQLSHAQRLAAPYDLADTFLEQVSGLGEKLGALLVQLPPKAVLVPETAHQFFTYLRERYRGRLACEPRHTSYFTPEADTLLRTYDVARVAADPPRAPTDGRPGGSPSFTYTRLHGSPRIYYSAYPPEILDALAAKLRGDHRDHWVIFDNTTLGAAANDALGLLDRYNGPVPTLHLERRAHRSHLGKMKAKERRDDPRKKYPKPPFKKQTQDHPGIEAEMKDKPDYGADTYVGKGRLEGKVALITGGDSGIGRAVALAFAREGADIAFQYLNEREDAQVTEGLVRECGQRVVSFAHDLDNDSACKELIAQSVEAFDRIDILVNNAAYQGKSVEKFEELDAERVEKSFRVNIIAMYHLVRHALPHMEEGSAVINVGSIQAYNPSAEILDYAATKGAIVAFSKGLAQSLIERGIRVNCVAPGPVWTPLIQASFDAEKVSTFGKDSPMERPAQPAELAPLFVFLASNESSYVNGEVLGATGGKPLG